MNSDRIGARWKQVKGRLKASWGKWSGDDLGVIAGRREQLLGRIQERHGTARDAPGRELRRGGGKPD